MEPFALFNLLKSFLPQPENSKTQPPSETETETKISTPNEPASVSDPTQNGEPKDPPSQNYCLDFIRRHEERAGRKR